MIVIIVNEMAILVENNIVLIRGLYLIAMPTISRDITIMTVDSCVMIMTKLPDHQVSITDGILLVAMEDIQGDIPDRAIGEEMTIRLKQAFGT